ncbi:hypothetical protein B7C42_06048 [Nocardia cerradoensis]|uniref:Uncharacterized protein n=1 Tax=Nocardia cerradoensis TaxID=85688 RepID=A0A231GYM1_9NOCA|nr:hypothetical protein B7C42_06048 [Nocardia cerradoensis]
MYGSFVNAVIKALAAIPVKPTYLAASSLWMSTLLNHRLGKELPMMPPIDGRMNAAEVWAPESPAAVSEWMKKKCCAPRYPLVTTRFQV